MKARIWAALAAMTMASPALAESAPGEPRWSASLSGGTATLEGRGGQPFFSVGLTRNFSDGYLRLSGTHIDTRDGQGLIGAVPAKTRQIALSGGISFGAFDLDAYGLLGKRKFGAETFRRVTGQTIAITSNGSTSGIGASLTYNLVAGKHGFVSPFLALDYSRVDTARAINTPLGGLITQKEKQDGVTFTAGSSAQLLFGPDDSHNAGLYGAFVTSSNATAYNRGTSPIAAARFLGALDVPGTKDSWAEYGATASFRVARPLRLDLSLIRTAGFGQAESTSGSVGLRISF